MRTKVEDFTKMKELGGDWDWEDGEGWDKMVQVRTS